MPGFIITKIEFPRRAAIAVNDDLSLYDESGSRRRIIEGFLKQGPAEKAALNAFGSPKWGSPMIERSRMETLMHRSHGAPKAIDELAGIVQERASREARWRRTVIWWLVYDMYERAQVAPRRIEAEQKLRTIVGQKSTLGDLRRYAGVCEIVIGSIQETEIAYGASDLLQLPSIAREGIEAFQDFIKRYDLGGPPLWRPILGVARTGGVEGTRVAIAKQSALGAFAVVLSGLINERSDHEIAKLAEIILGGDIDARDVGYSRKVFLEQRGFE